MRNQTLHILEKQGYPNFFTYSQILSKILPKGGVLYLTLDLGYLQIFGEAFGDMLANVTMDECFGDV